MSGGASPEPAVATAGLHKRYDRRFALRDVDLVVPRGACLRLHGPNGSGKSTLLRILAALTRPTRGRVEVLGRRVFGRDAAAQRARVAYLGSDSGLYRELSVRENLRFAAELRGASAADADALLEPFDLLEVADQRARTLSLGYHRRASLARALLGEPELLLLDEPWNGLDPEACARLGDALEARRRAGATLLVATHQSPVDLAYDGSVAFERGRVHAP